MSRDFNIWRIAKILIPVLSVCFLLTACNGGEEDTAHNDQRTPIVSSAGTMDDKPVSTGAEASSLSKEHRTCWQTGVLQLMYEQMGIVSLGMYEQITEGSMALMMVAFAIWFSFRLMRHVSSLQEENIAETWNEVFKQLFLCFACGLIASSTGTLLFLLNTVIFPLYYAFLEFAGEMLNAATISGNSGTASFPFLGEIMSYGEPVRCTADKLVLSDKLNSFPEAPLKMMECMACAVNERLSPGFSLSFKSLFETGLWVFVIGLLIFIIFTFIKLAFVFYLVDTLFRFTIVVTILPILVMAYAFKNTRSWMTQGFYTMLNSAAYMMFIAIMIAVALLAMEEIMQSPELGLTSSNLEEVKYSFRELSIPFLCLLLLAFLIVSTMSIAQQLTDSLVGGSSGSNFQKRGGKALAMVAKWLTLGMTTRLMKLANAGRKKAGRGIKNGAIKGFNKMKGAFKK